MENFIVKKNWIEEGMEVANKYNPKQIMIVSRILRQYIDKSVLEDGRLIEKKIQQIIGIECHWWEDNKFKIHKFHTRELIPWVVVQDGEKTIKWFIETINSL